MSSTRNVQLQHTLCSTHNDRLEQAERLLAAAGLPHKREIAEVGSCIDAEVTSPFTAQALERQVTTFCGIAAAARISYSSWSGSVGGGFVFVSGNYVAVAAPGEKPALRLRG